jgi:hypothetical protein
VAIETLAMLVNTVLSFIPGRIGTAEGVRTALWVLVGFTAVQGIAYGLVRRARELVWLVPASWCCSSGTSSTSATCI